MSTKTLSADPVKGCLRIRSGIAGGIRGIEDLNGCVEREKVIRKMLMSSIIVILTRLGVS